jgi:adenylate cyclase
MAEEGFKRKLTAILSADVAGYSRLMAEDETHTVKTIATYREIMSSLIKQHRGRVVDSPGDNVLAEFSSVVDAVQCAVAVQTELQTRNEELAENRRMEFRIGINLGDVIDEDDRIYGDGVNIAARLESLADPGGICVSKTAFDQIETKLPLGYEYLGEQSVKNIPKPVRAYRVLMKPDAAGKVIGEKRFLGRYSRRTAMAAIIILVMVAGGLVSWNIYLQQSKKVEPASVEKMAFPLPDKPSIAVLPFTNMSGEKEQEYFCDGLSEGIINALAKTDRLFVIARNSTFTYKGKPAKVKQVAEDLGVRYVLEGSIQKAGDRVRITAQLIDALTGHHLFSERYDRELKDILNLQDEITMKVLTAVQVELTVGEGALVFAKGTNNLDAYLRVLQAREHKGGTMNKERVEKAMQLLEEAIALDPEYAYAYSILSTAYFDLVVIGASDTPRESLRRAVELGKKAVSLDESNPYAHANLAFPYMYLKVFDKAISEAEKGVSLAPNYAGGYFALGAVLKVAGRPQEAIPILQKCLRLSPVPVHSQVLGILASAYKELGQYEEAIATYKKVLHVYGPDQLLAHLGLAGTYAIMDREKEARSEGAEVMRIDPEFALERFIKSLPYDQSKKDRIADDLRKAGLK